MKILDEIKNHTPYNEQEKIDKDFIIEHMLRYENIFHRNCNIAHMSASAIIVNKDRNKILFAYHNLYDSWGWLGGHADGDENLLEVCEKEVTEESGLTNFKLISDGIAGLENMPVNSHFKKGKFITAHLHLNITYIFEADEKDDRIAEEENSDITWMDIDTCLDNVNEEHMKSIYEKYIILAKKL